MLSGNRCTPCRLLWVTFACLIYLAHASELSAAITYRIVTDEQGAAAPDITPDAEFWGLNRMNLNQAGQTILLSRIDSPYIQADSDAGIWSEGSGELRLLAQEGGPAPGAGVDVKFVDSGLSKHIQINDAGQSAFQARLTGLGVDATNDQGIWTGGFGTLQLLTRTGEAAPGTGAGVVYSDLSSEIAMNASGQIAFRASLSGPGVESTNDNGLWSGAAGTLGLVVRSGDQAPGTDAGIKFNEFDIPAFQDNGQLTLRAGLSGPGVDGTNDKGIWTAGPSSSALIVRTGEQAPGTEPDVRFSNFILKGDFLTNTPSIPMVNHTGRLAFLGQLTGPGVDSTNDTGIWAQDSGQLQLITRTGAQVPGMAPGVVFTNLSQPILNDSGKIAFYSAFDGPGISSTTNTAIWLADDGLLKLIAREGDHAPGTFNATFKRFTRDPVINNAGQVAFSGQLYLDANDNGVWATDPAGTLALVGREGGYFDTNNDPLIEELRYIGAIGVDQNALSAAGHPIVFNDAGQLSLFFDFGGVVASIGLTGDLNFDGFVGIEDLNIVLSYWNQNVTPGVQAFGDINGDGYVGILDLNAVLSGWNMISPSTALIPEPATLTLLSGVFWVINRRHRIS